MNISHLRLFELSSDKQYSATCDFCHKRNMTITVVGSGNGGALYEFCEECRTCPVRRSSRKTKGKRAASPEPELSDNSENENKSYVIDYTKERFIVGRHYGGTFKRYRTSDDIEKSHNTELVTGDKIFGNEKPGCVLYYLTDGFSQPNKGEYLFTSMKQLNKYLKENEHIKNSLPFVEGLVHIK